MKLPLTLAKRIENMFTFLYAAEEDNSCRFDPAFLDEVKAAALRGAELPQYVGESKWISVKDRLPPECEEVLLDHLIDDHAHTIDIAWQKAGEWSFPWIGRLAKADCAPVWPVRWMPLPTLESSRISNGIPK